MKNFTPLIIVVLLIIIGAAAYFMFFRTAPTATPGPVATTPDTTATTTEDKSMTVIGKSVQNNDIVAYHYGTGSTEILFVGGVHGGYEWNTVLVARELMDYLKAHPEAIPSNETVTVIPVMNPDGLSKVVGTTGEFTAADVSTSQTVSVAGRFNANNVDLNRNFDCHWQAKGTWQSTTVSGGTAAFSEPESQAIQSYVTAHKPAAAVIWYSSAGGVYSGGCDSIGNDTKALTTLYANASGYPAHSTFTAYATTGDMSDWFSKIGIPSISVLLTNHTDTEWSKNQKGIDALLQNYAE